MEMSGGYPCELPCLRCLPFWSIYPACPGPLPICRYPLAVFILITANLYLILMLSRSSLAIIILVAGMDIMNQWSHQTLTSNRVKPGLRMMFAVVIRKRRSKRWPCGQCVTGTWLRLREPTLSFCRISSKQGRRLFGATLPNLNMSHPRSWAYMARRLIFCALSAF